MSSSMERWNGKVAIVTGSTAGIGKAICENLVRNGLKVVGFARREVRNNALAKELEGGKGKFHPLTVDVTKEEDIKNGFKWVKENLGPVHILVNNAGLSQNNTLIGGDTEKWKRILDTNILGLCICTREAIESMKEKNIDGHIIHINSVLGHYSTNFPFLNVYGASKYAVTALTETLRNELTFNKSKIKVTSVSPGIVKTEMLQASGFDIKEMIEAVKNAPVLESEDVADAVEYTLSTPPHVQVHEIIMRPVGEMI